MLILTEKVEDVLEYFPVYVRLYSRGIVVQAVIKSGRICIKTADHTLVTGTVKETLQYYAGIILKH
jgi:hypothetical protein